jgi:t-SNARE complex subunit (syntaxin)
MTREEFIKQRCEIDKITEEEFERTYRVVECNCGKIYCNGYRCLDLDGLLKENQELKKQLEEYKKDIEDLDNQNQRAFKNMQLNQLKTCNMIKQQKEFIKWLENYINLFDKKDIYEEGSCDTIEEILQRYKSIIGGSDEKK